MDLQHSTRLCHIRVISILITATILIDSCTVFAQCPDGFVFDSSSCYYFSKEGEQSSGINLESSCDSHGAYPVVIETVAENNFILSQTSKHSHLHEILLGSSKDTASSSPWYSYGKERSTWFWTQTIVAGYWNWDPDIEVSQLSGHGDLCALFRKWKSGVWATTNCGGTFVYMCEVDAVITTEKATTVKSTSASTEVPLTTQGTNQDTTTVFLSSAALKPDVSSTAKVSRHQYTSVPTTLHITTAEVSSSGTYRQLEASSIETGLSQSTPTEKFTRTPDYSAIYTLGACISGYIVQARTVAVSTMSCATKCLMNGVFCNSFQFNATSKSCDLLTVDNSNEVLFEEHCFTMVLP